jgi:hypothetical protein
MVYLTTAQEIGWQSAQKRGLFDHPLAKEDICMCGLKRFSANFVTRFSFIFLALLCSHTIAEQPEALVKEPKLLIDGGTHLDWVWDIVLDRDQRNTFDRYRK